jgi:hypothetical protein
MHCSHRLLLVFFALSASLMAQSNPVPFVNQPLVPSAVAPGSASFVLTVNGAGFVPGAVVNWNGNALATTYVNHDRLTATVLDSEIAASGTALVTAANPAPGGGTSNAVPFTITNPTASLAFAASTLPVGLNPGAVVVADFNNDGKTDLAVVNQNQPDPTCYTPARDNVGTISILLGNGDGTFSNKATLCFPDFLGDFAGPQLVAGDFNGDGKTDLIASFWSLGLWDFKVFLGNGDGTFRSGQSNFGNFDRIGPVISGDFNGDGNLDFALQGGAGDFEGIFAFTGNNGNFTCCSGFGPTSVGASLATGDFNNDGILDLALIALINAGQPPVTILLGNGDGTFTAAAVQPSVTLVNPVFVTTNDFDGDGKLDLAIADAGFNALTVLHGNGDGTFTQVSGEPSLPQFSTFVTAADLNGDGKLDLVFSNSCGTACTSNAISIFLGNGDGTFKPGFSETVGNAPHAVAVGDFNGDGRLDIAVVNSADNTVTLLLQTLGYVALVQPPINADGSSSFKATRGVVPVKFTLTQGGFPTCSLPSATISVTRTAGGALGTVDENMYLANADSGSNFRIDSNACQYIYNLAASPLGVGTYRVDISINGIVVGNAVFALK